MADQQVDLSHMELGDDLVLAAEVIGSLQVAGILAKGADGHYAFVDPGTGGIVTEAQAIEALLKSHNVKIPDNVDRIIQGLGLVLSLLGVK